MGGGVFVFSPLFSSFSWEVLSCVVSWSRSVFGFCSLGGLVWSSPPAPFVGVVVGGCRFLRGRGGASAGCFCSRSASCCPASFAGVRRLVLLFFRLLSFCRRWRRFLVFFLARRGAVPLAARVGWWGRFLFKRSKPAYATLQRVKQRDKPNARRRPSARARRKREKQEQRGENQCFITMFK